MNAAVSHGREKVGPVQRRGLINVVSVSSPANADIDVGTNADEDAVFVAPATTLDSLDIWRDVANDCERRRMASVRDRHEVWAVLMLPVPTASSTNMSVKLLSTASLGGVKEGGVKRRRDAERRVVCSARSIRSGALATRSGVGLSGDDTGDSIDEGSSREGSVFAAVTTGDVTGDEAWRRPRAL